MEVCRRESHEMMSPFFQRTGKKLWFAMFNLALVLYFALSGRMDRSIESIVSFFIVIFVMNAVALIAARNFPDWK
jgi:hypothetical protein